MPFVPVMCTVGHVELRRTEQRDELLDAFERRRFGACARAPGVRPRARGSRARRATAGRSRHAGASASRRPRSSSASAVVNVLDRDLGRRARCRRAPLRARRAARAVPSTCRVTSSVASETLHLALVPANPADDLGRHLEHELVAERRGLAELGEVAATTAACTDPSCHHDHTSSVDVRQERGEQALHHRRARRSNAAAADAAPSLPSWYARALHQLDVVVAEAPEEASRCVRARARSRTSSNAVVASRTSASSCGEHRPVERLGRSSPDRGRRRVRPR